MATQVPLLPPEGFDFAHPDSWTRWTKRFECYRLASGLSEKDEVIQVSTQIYTMGDKAEEIFDSFGLSETDAKSTTRLPSVSRNISYNDIIRFLSEPGLTSALNSRERASIPSSQHCIPLQSIASTDYYVSK